MQYAIETSNLTKRYSRHKTAVDNLNLVVPAGSVYVLLGCNGAGKTTTIRMLMGLLRKSAGDIAVLGLDPDKEPVALKRRVGFVADNQKMYDWMTVREIIGFCRPFYPTWDDNLVSELVDLFGLPAGSRLRDLSRGMYGKVALLLGLAHRPELLILDDPTSGLDPLARREFMEGVIGVIQQQERTVFFSTHIVDEAEQVADWIGILDGGKLLLSQALEEVKENIKQIKLLFDAEPPSDIDLPGIVKRQSSGRELLLTVRDYTPQLTESLGRYNPRSVEVLDMCLEDIFVSLVSRKQVDR
ncbi:MAG: ABC transporter ATP-binding protein [bacterium]|nr:ABC transporter ATP-binding protein [bacterium]